MPPASRGDPPRAKEAIALRRLWVRGAAGRALVAVLAAFLVAAPAQAAPQAAGGFADGSDFASIALEGGPGAFSGPALRFPKDATLTAASLVVGGRYAAVNVTRGETTASEFASYSGRVGVDILDDTLQLASVAEVVTFDRANAFGNASFDAVHLDGEGRITLDGDANGTFTTAPVTAPFGGWGSFAAAADVPAGCWAEFSLLDPIGAVLVPLQVPGAVVDLDSKAAPVVRVHAALGCASPGPAPAVSWFSLGQRAQDTLLGDAATRTALNLRAVGHNYTLAPVQGAWVESAKSPYIAGTPGTYHSERVEDVNFIRVGSTWHMFAATSNTSIHRIGHATSPDLENWTWDDSLALVPGPELYDAYQMDHPFVVANGTGAGYLMYYSAWESQTRMQAAVATSLDLVHWTKFGGNPILPASASGWDAWNTGNPIVFYESGAWRMWYSGSNSNGGGGNALGYATSSDGFTWTRSASNPLLDRGGSGAIDQDDLQLKALRFWAGKYRAFFACNQPNQYRICAAESADGLAWSKLPGAVISPSGTGWESWDVFPGDVVVVDDHPTLFYGGCSASCHGSGCPTGCTGTMTGRADAPYTPGTMETIFDFDAHGAHVLTGASVQAEAPPGAGVQLEVQSSQDGATWSGPEPVTTGGAVVTTAAQRFVRLTVRMQGSPERGAPVYHGVALDYESYRSQGRYMSSAIDFPFAVLGVRAEAVLVEPGGSVAIEISGEVDPHWTPAPPGHLVPLDPPTARVSYALTLVGTSSTTPVVDRVELTAPGGGFPENVTIRLGDAGPLLYNGSGPLNTTLNLTLAPEAINAYVEARRAADSSAPYLDIRLVVSATNAGAVDLGEPRMAFEFKEGTALFPTGALDPWVLFIVITAGGVGVLAFYWRNRRKEWEEEESPDYQRLS